MFINWYLFSLNTSIFQFAPWGTLIFVHIYMYKGLAYFFFFFAGGGGGGIKILNCNNWGGGGGVRGGGLFRKNTIFGVRGGTLNFSCYIGLVSLSTV